MGPTSKEGKGGGREGRGRGKEGRDGGDGRERESERPPTRLFGYANGSQLSFLLSPSLHICRPRYIGIGGDPQVSWCPDAPQHLTKLLLCIYY